MNPFFSTVYAQEGGAPAQQPMSVTLVWIGIMFLLFYLILWRPQSKRAKEHKDLVSSISKGDEVMTSGGLLGKVTKVTDDWLVVNIANGVDITLQKSSVASALPKGTISQIQS